MVAACTPWDTFIGTQGFGPVRSALAGAAAGFPCSRRWQNCAMRPAGTLDVCCPAATRHHPQTTTAFAGAGGAVRRRPRQVFAPHGRTGEPGRSLLAPVTCTCSSNPASVLGGSKVSCDARGRSAMHAPSCMRSLPCAIRPTTLPTAASWLAGACGHGKGVQRFLSGLPARLGHQPVPSCHPGRAPPSE